MKYNSVFNKEDLMKTPIFEVLRKENPCYLYELGTDTEEFQCLLAEISKYDIDEFNSLELRAVSVLLKRFNPNLRILSEKKEKRAIIISDNNFGFVVDVVLKFREINPNPYGIIGLMTVEDAENLSGLTLLTQQKGNFIDVQIDFKNKPELKKLFGVESEHQRIARMIYITRGGSIGKDDVVHHLVDGLNHTNITLLTREIHNNLPIDSKHPKEQLCRFISQICNITIAEAKKYFNDIFTLASYFNFARGIHIERDLIKNPLSDNESVVDLIKSMRLDQRYNKL